MELAGEAGLSQRQLERRFRAAVGVPPKALARVLPGCCRRSARARPIGTGVALDHGYFHQPHLIRDFQELAGEIEVSAQNESSSRTRTTTSRSGSSTGSCLSAFSAIPLCSLRFIR
jgi:transcriptional regulator GlxA family with amidase domain